MDLSTLAKHDENSSEPSAHSLSIVTGSRGQDGSYLRDLIGHDKSIGCINPNSISRARALVNEFQVDLGNKDSVLDLLSNTRPKSIFHLAARHGPSTKMTFGEEDLGEMKKLHVDATRNLLEAIEVLGLGTHLIVAGSSRIFSPTEEITRVSEDTPPNPQDFYGESKLAAWELVKKARDEFGTRASFLVLFNHESPRRPEGYFSSDIAKAIIEFLVGSVHNIQVRDSGAFGDWSDARDVVDLMVKTAELDRGQDFVVSSGVLRGVEEIITSTFSFLGHGTTPVIDSTTNHDHNPRLYLKGENQKSLDAGIWAPQFTIGQTIAEMVRAGFEAREK
jgi:GDPmannose 4,6-dehydratase